MTSSLARKILKTLNPSAVTSAGCGLNVAVATGNAGKESSSLIFSSEDPGQSRHAADQEKDDVVYIKGREKTASSSSSVGMRMSFMTGSIIGKRFYKKVTTREADDGIGWSLMLDYRMLKPPLKRNLRCHTLALAKPIGAEWEFQAEGIYRGRDQVMQRAVMRAIRTIQTVTECPRLTKFSLHAPKSVEVKFDNGSTYNLSAEYLRVYSPAVNSKIRSIGGEKVISGRRHVGIMSAEPVGNYGVRILFDDLHKTGIYTWDYLYHLSSNKFSLMRNYVKTLKKHGLSRDPPRKK